MVKQRRGAIYILIIILLILNLLAVVSLFFSYAAQYVDPRDSWLFALFGLLYPWILISNACFIVVWLFIRQKYALISLVAILIGWKQLSAMITFPSENKVLLPGQNISLLSWNVHGFAGLSDWLGNVRPEIVEYLAEEGPDLICLQEVHIHESDFQPVLRSMSKVWGMPYYYIRDYYHVEMDKGFNGIVTFSKFPIVGKGSLDHKPKKCFGIYTDLKLESDTIRLFNLHLASLRLGQNDINFYYQLKKNETEIVKVKAGVFSILKKLKQAFILRASESDLLNEAILESPYPVIVCGDMNDSPFSYTYRQATQSLSDTYSEAGAGFFGSTYDGAMPNYRIDYLLYDRHFNAFSYKKSDVKFSDHYPISGLFMLNH